MQTNSFGQAVFAQYSGGFYFIIAVLSLRNSRERGSLTERWVGLFGTNRRQLSQFFSKLAEAYVYGKIITDEEGKPIDWIYLDVNNKFENILAKKREEIVGRKATEVYPTISEDPADWINLYGKVALTGEANIFDRHLTVTNSGYYVTVYSPESHHFIAIFEDITDRKKAEDNLKQTNENLERLVEERTKKLRDSERLAAIGATAGMVGHDIRNTQSHY